MITARYFSSNPSDSTSRWTPCPPVVRKRTERQLRFILGSIHRFQLRARLEFILLVFPGQRRITAAFGYGTPHPSARGTSTLLTHALPSAHYEPVRHPKRPGLLLTEVRLRDTTSHRRGFPCCLLIPLSHMPSPLPRQDWSTLVARDSTNGGLPQRTFGSALTLLVSRIAQRLLTLWPACSLTPYRSLFQECFSPIRYLLEPPRVLPAGAKVAGRDSHPLESSSLSRHTDRR